MTPTPPATPRSRLTPRETECVTLAASGLSVAQTAQHLNLAERTVEFHLQNAMRKLGAATKLRAVVLALQQQLIAP